MLSPLEESLLAVLMVLIMLGMGSALTFRDVALAFARPRALAIGLASQYLWMPALGYGLALAFNLDDRLTAAMVLMGCMPGGTTSNIFAYFSRSDLALSLLMTVCSTLAAVLLVPVLMEVYTASLDAAVRIPPLEISALLGLLVVPTLAGMVLRRRNANAGALVELAGAVLGVVVILFLILSWLPRNGALVIETPVSVHLAIALLGVLGFAGGLVTARLAGLDPRRARTVSLETGIQNGPLAALIVVLMFPPAMQADALLVPVLYSLFIVALASALTLVYRAWDRAEERRRGQGRVGG